MKSSTYDENMLKSALRKHSSSRLHVGAPENSGHLNLRRTLMLILLPALSSATRKSSVEYLESEQVWNPYDHNEGYGAKRGDLIEMGNQGIHLIKASVSHGRREMADIVSEVSEICDSIDQKDWLKLKEASACTNEKYDIRKIYTDESSWKRNEKNTLDLQNIIDELFERVKLSLETNDLFKCFEPVLAANQEGFPNSCMDLLLRYRRVGDSEEPHGCKPHHDGQGHHLRCVVCIKQAQGGKFYAYNTKRFHRMKDPKEYDQKQDRFERCSDGPNVSVGDIVLIPCSTFHFERPFWFCSVNTEQKNLGAIHYVENVTEGERVRLVFDLLLKKKKGYKKCKCCKELKIFNDIESRMARTPRRERMNGCDCAECFGTQYVECKRSCIANCLNFCRWCCECKDEAFIPRTIPQDYSSMTQLERGMLAERKLRISQPKKKAKFPYESMVELVKTMEKHIEFKQITHNHRQRTIPVSFDQIETIFRQHPFSDLKEEPKGRVRSDRQEVLRQLSFRAHRKYLEGLANDQVQGVSKDS